MRALMTTQINNPVSPVRRYLDERFTVGVRAVERRYRDDGPPLFAPSAPACAHLSTLGTAPNRVLRFLLDSQPDLADAVNEARVCASADLDITPALTSPADRHTVAVFTGPAPGTDAVSDLLARARWALALLTRVARSAPFAPAHHPHTPPAAAHQLSALREIFERTLIPQLAKRIGPWALGAAFGGSHVLASDASVIAAALLLNPPTSAKACSPGQPGVFQLIGCALLDLDGPDSFSTGYRHLVTWELDIVPAELAATPVHLPTLRAQFRTLAQPAPQLSGAVVSRTSNGR